jgi:hypothetical protein
VTSNSGDNGGANFSATQTGGAGSLSTATAGSAGTGDSNGASGGGGGAGLTPAGSASNGGNGGNGQEFDGSHGSGGGGGGGGGSDTGGGGGQGGAGGGGGLYGGGGGSGGWNSVNGGGGSGGGSGIIVITYTPAISATILAESRNAMEHQTVGRIDAFDAIEFGQSVPSDVGMPTEGRREIRSDGETPIEASCAALCSSRIPLQWAGSLALWMDALMPFEAAAVPHGDTLGFVEFASVIARNAQSRLELLTILSSEALLAAEALTKGARISADGPLCLEWADPPSLLILAPERLLRSPGRVRVLAAPGSIHPLRSH